MYTHLLYLVNVTIKFFFLLTPFFVLSMFLSMTSGEELKARQRLAIRVTLAVVVTGLILFFFGNAIFAVFGITLDAFRIGAGALLFLSAVDLVRGTHERPRLEPDEDFAVVPLAIPITIGPGTTGALLVMGAESASGVDRVLGLVGLIIAVMAVGGMLVAASSLERWLGKRILSILSKLTGLILSALAAQMIFAGIHGFL